MARFSLITAGFGSLAYATVAHAHPGHGEPGDDFSFMHYATQPLHVGVSVCLLAAAAILFHLVRVSYARHRADEAVR